MKVKFEPYERPLHHPSLLGWDKSRAGIMGMDHLTVVPKIIRTQSATLGTPMVDFSIGI